MHQNLFCGLSHDFFLYSISVQQWPWNSTFNRIFQWLLDITVYFYLVGDLRIASFVHFCPSLESYSVDENTFPSLKKWLSVAFAFKIALISNYEVLCFFWYFCFLSHCCRTEEIMDFARTTSSFDNPKAKSLSFCFYSPIPFFNLGGL